MLKLRERFKKFLAKYFPVTAAQLEISKQLLKDAKRRRDPKRS